MSFRIMIIFMTLVIMTAACTKQQDGVLTGTVAPPTGGVRIIALQNGKSITSTEANPQDGRFRMNLPPGLYDVSVSAPSSPFPQMFPMMTIKSGNTTELPLVDFPRQQTGHAVLSGRIYPGGDKTTVTLYEEDKERASVQTDKDGKYEFTSLPAGKYLLRTSAPEYAQTAEEFTIADDQRTIHNLRLLYAKETDGVDWTAGKIHVTGTGFPPPNTANPVIRHELARRAAITDAQRNLLKVLDGLKVGPDQSLKAFWGDKKFNITIRGLIQGFKVVSERELAGGKIELDVELPLSGPSGLAPYLNE